MTRARVRQDGGLNCWMATGPPGVTGVPAGNAQYLRRVRPRARVGQRHRVHLREVVAGIELRDGHRVALRPQLRGVRRQRGRTVPPRRARDVVARRDAVQIAAVGQDGILRHAQTGRGAAAGGRRGPGGRGGGRGPHGDLLRHGHQRGQAAVHAGQGQWAVGQVAAGDGARAVGLDVASDLEGGGRDLEKAQFGGLRVGNGRSGVGEEGGGARGGAIKAEGVSRVILPGVCTCSHFEEGILRVAHPNSRGALFLVEQSGTLGPLLKSAASAPWRPSYAGAGRLHTKSFPRQRSLGGAHHRWREVAEGRGGVGGPGGAGPTATALQRPSSPTTLTFPMIAIAPQQHTTTTTAPHKHHSQKPYCRKAPMTTATTPNTTATTTTAATIRICGACAISPTCGITACEQCGISTSTPSGRWGGIGRGESRWRSGGWRCWLCAAVGDGQRSRSTFWNRVLTILPPYCSGIYAIVWWE